MDSVLYKIIEIERAAQSISDEATSAKKNLPKEIDDERQKISAQIEQQINSQLEQFTTEESKKEQERIEKIELAQKQQMDSLQKLFQNNFEKWEEEIYQTIRKK